MSDTSRVKSDTKRGEVIMRALADTAGMQTPERAVFWLEKLAIRAHRGPHDTWTAARERAAQDAGVKLTTAQRIWQRWETMNDVGGDALLKLMVAYEAMCTRNNDAADAYDAERLKIEARNGTSQEPVSTGEGMGAPEMGAKKGEVR